jgi:hypothetical protein
VRHQPTQQAKNLEKIKWKRERGRNRAATNGKEEKKLEE